MPAADLPPRPRKYVIVFPPEVEREIQKTLDDAARRLFEERLAARVLETHPRRSRPRKNRD